MNAYPVSNFILILLALVCFLIISIYLYPDKEVNTEFPGEKQELLRRVDSLSYLLEKLNKEVEMKSTAFYKKEEKPHKVTSYEPLIVQPENRVNTVFVIIRDTMNEVRLKEKLARAQLEKFELSKLVDSLQVLTSLEKKRDEI